jgi:hypothetical protein
VLLGKTGGAEALGKRAPRGGTKEARQQLAVLREMAARISGRALGRGAPHVLVAIAKKRLGVEASLYTILQILSLTLFEKIPLDQLFNDTALENFDGENPTQLNLFS